jgi:hypothetical protein
MSNKALIAVVLLIVLVVASGAIIYAMQAPSEKKVVVGVHVGDTFTYSLRGVSNLGIDATEPSWFSQYNNTDYYKIVITDVNNTSVTMDTTWKMLNGTETRRAQTIDLATGIKSDMTGAGFWAIYAANLNKNDLVRPRGADGLIVNSTDTKTYANSTRERNIWSLQNDFFDTTDPTYSTYRNEFTSVYFDKQTGMLDTLSNVQQYNNPAYALIITWQLVSCSVWDV